jgi:peptide/nickel transport system substrate-binding protein
MGVIRATVSGWAVLACLGLVVGLTTPGAAQPRLGGTAVMAQAGNIPTLDPHFSGSGETRNVVTHIYEGLVALDESANPIPDLAESYEYAPDGMSVTFRLRHGVMFHNGSEMKAADVVASLQRYRRLSPNRALLEPMAAAETPDDYTVVLRLSRKAPTLVEEMASPATVLGIMPAADGAAAGGKNSNVGTGPFKFASWVADSHVILERFPSYSANPHYQKRDGYGGKKTAYFDRVIIRVVPEAGARLSGLQTGEYQVVEQIPAAVANDLAGDKSLKVYDMMPWWMIIAWLDNGLAPTDNIDVRRAIQIAINQKEVMAFATQDFYRLNYSFQYPNSRWYPGPETVNRYNLGDVAGAKALLAKAGLPSPKITIVASADFDVCANAGIVVAQQLTAAGFQVDLRTVDHPTFTAMRQKPEGWNIEICGAGIEPFLGAYAYNRLMAGKPNSMHAYSPVLDAAWAQILGSDSFEQRKAGWAKLEQTIHEQALVVKLGDAGIKQAAVAKLQGFVPFRSPRLWDVWFDK